MEEIKKVEVNIGGSNNQNKKYEKKFSGMDRISYIFLLATVFLLPLFFIPSKFSSLELSKVLMVVFFTMFSLSFWSIARLRSGKFEFANSLLLLSSFFILFVYFLSSIFSNNKAVSFLGQGYEISTFGLVCVAFVFMFLISSVFRSKNRILYSYTALFASFFIIFLFEIIRLFFGPNFLSLGLFTDITSNMIGKWNDLGIYFGLIALLSAVTLELTALNKKIRFLLYFSSLSSLFFLSVINFKSLWYIVGIFAFIFFIYSISFRKYEFAKETAESANSSARKIPYFVLFFLIVSIVFIADGMRSKHFIGDSIANYFKISQIEVRPSLLGTMGILKQSLKENPILGAGPNSFLNSWILFKPDSINSTVFWNADFNYGAGIIPTFITTTGILGIISWLLFFGLLLYTGFKFIFIKTKDLLSHYLIISSFLGSLYLWIISILYVANSTVFYLTFFFTGIFIASLWNENLLFTRSLAYLGNTRRSFISVILLVVIVISSFTIGYVYFQKFLSSLYFQKALYSANISGNLNEAEKYAMKAISFSKIDAYYRLLSGIYLNRLNSLNAQKNTSNEILNDQFKTLFQAAIVNGQNAIDADKTNYQNYLSLGRVYEFVMPINGAYKFALDNYTEALRLNPKSPLINLILARLEMANKNNVKAREYITKSLQMKNNYTEAAFLLAQIEIAEGNIKNAIQLVEAASTLTFNNPVAHFQLGILKYSDTQRDYKGAAEAFEKAVSLNPSYSNARYFLGLSYYNLGKIEDAVKQFETVKSFNPDNTEVELILNNLKEGRAPFASAKPPIDDKPEKRKNLPVKDGSKKESTQKEE